MGLRYSQEGLGERQRDFAPSKTVAGVDSAGQRRDGTGQCGLRLAADQSRRPVSLAKRCPTPPSQADASAVTPVGRRAGPAASPRFLSDSTKSQALR